jgi:hypothetical protein
MNFFSREILLLVNLCVALANAYITPLPLSAADILSASNTETVPVSQQGAPTTKKGVKADQQVAATSTGSPGSSPGSVKNDDFKAALDVNYFAKYKNLINSFFFNKRYVNMQ